MSNVRQASWSKKNRGVINRAMRWFCAPTSFVGRKNTAYTGHHLVCTKETSYSVKCKRSWSFRWRNIDEVYDQTSKYYHSVINSSKQFHSLLNDREFWLILLIRDWPRRGLLDRTSEWVHRKCLTTVYSGSLWCHNENAGFRVKFLLRLASLMCIFLWRHNIRTSFRADFCLRLTTPWTFLCD